MGGLAIGNGLTDTETQYKYYPQMAFDGGKTEGGTLAQGVITDSVVQGIMTAGSPLCTKAIQLCNRGIFGSCQAAFVLCNYAEMVPYTLTGYNQYDMREKCEVRPMCYDFSFVTSYLNQPEVQKSIGASGKWSSCNFLVNAFFRGDFMVSYHKLIPPLLKDGIKVLIYAGDADFICNWLGNKHWTLNLDWEGKDAYNKAAEQAYNVKALAGKEGGRLRAKDGLHFMQVYQAGHMVPMNQPEMALSMLNDFIQGKLPSDTTNSTMSGDEVKIMV